MKLAKQGRFTNYFTNIPGTCDVSPALSSGRV